jgi:polynucleotide 5'-kinase involved in rRNA processing
MGYITGLGEILLYEIYNIINPTEIIVLSNDRWPQSKEENLDNILFKIKSGQYYKNLLFKT